MFNNILLCDDDDDDRFLFQDAMLEVNPHANVHVANNCKQLMTSLQNADVPDILFLDLNMPVKDGRECLREIRQDMNFHLLPIVIYSTSITPADIDDTFAKGANLYIQKASSFSSLKQAISKVLALDKKELLNNAKPNFVIYSTLNN